jgi:hypothetical protein
MQEGKTMSDKRSSKWYRQRKKMGFDDRATWCLDHTLAEYILPRLKRFREVTYGYPGNITMEEWQVILDKMIYSMQAIVDEWNNVTIDRTDKDFRKEEVKVHQGLCLFGKYFRHLWW